MAGWDINDWNDLTLIEQVEMAFGPGFGDRQLVAIRDHIAAMAQSDRQPFETIQQAHMRHLQAQLVAHGKDGSS